MRGWTHEFIINSLWWMLFSDRRDLVPGRTP
jgi:hypothetical protein